MDSLDAQCLLVALSTDEECVPATWTHRRDGSLSCRFADSARDLTWPPKAVAEIASRWRDEDHPELPPHVRRMIETHRAFAELYGEGELEQPEEIRHDLETCEVHAVWGDRCLLVTIDCDDANHDAVPSAS